MRILTNITFFEDAGAAAAASAGQAVLGVRKKLRRDRRHGARA